MADISPTVQRRASNTGILMVAGQKIALHRVHAGQVVTVHAADQTIAFDLEDQGTRTVRRTTTQRSAASRLTSPARLPTFPRESRKHLLGQTR
jgi:hypothetical protein